MVASSLHAPLWWRKSTGGPRKGFGVRTSDALLKPSLLLLATHGGLEERVEDRMHAVRIARGMGWACTGEGVCNEGDATVECCGFLRTRISGGRESNRLGRRRQRGIWWGGYGYGNISILDSGGEGREGGKELWM